MLVLVHGAFHGAWCFERVEPELARHGIDVVTIELQLTTLAADAAIVRAQLDELDRDVVLLGHSYGGAVISASGHSPFLARPAELADVFQSIVVPSPRP